MKKWGVVTDMINMKQLIGFAAVCVLLFSIFAFLSAQQQSEGEESLPPIKIDDDFSDWQSIPDTATFTNRFNPYYFNKEEKGEMKAFPISESVFWGFNGTNIKEVKTLIDPSSVYFYITTFSPFSKGLIYFMYLHKGRQAGTENEYTIEVSVNDVEGSNDILLWTFGNENPSVIGTCRYDTKALEGKIDFAMLPEQLGKALVKFYSLDLTSCFFDKAKGFYEEFFFTSIWFRDIPTEEDL
jgi:hypothetical protein